MTPIEISQWMNSTIHGKTEEPRLDFTGSEMTEEEFNYMVPGGRRCFNDLLFTIAPRMRNSCNRSIPNALAMFLLTIRFGLTQHFQAILFRTSQQVVSDSIATVSDLLLELFVPRHLGFAHLSRDVAITQHTPDFVNTLLSNDRNMKIVIDGMTYQIIVTQKVNAIFFSGTYVYVE